MKQLLQNLKVMPMGYYNLGEAVKTESEFLAAFVEWDYRGDLR